MSAGRSASGCSSARSSWPPRSASRSSSTGGRYEAGPFYRFLDWNLFLAWLPVVFALTATACVRGGLGALAIVPGVLWLLFFPNAPYMLTDFIHLQESPATPLWYDGLMLSAFAWTALLLGFFSLYLMQLLVRRLVGAPVAWLGVVAVLALGSFGVYIGRFIGFNSWDALLHPGRVAHVIDTRVESPVDHPRLAGLARDPDELPHGRLRRVLRHRGATAPARARSAGRVAARAGPSHRTGGGSPSMLAASAGSHAQTLHAWSTSERANASAVPNGSSLVQTSSQSRMNSPSVSSQRAAGGVSVALANPSGAGCA